MKSINNKIDCCGNFSRGFSLVELIVVMAIMCIVGATVFGLLRIGLSVLNRVGGDMAYETEARTALSLVTVQLRRHDATGAIDVKSSTEIWLYNDIELKTGTALIFVDGGLYSHRLRNGHVVGTGEHIANISGFSLDEDVSESGLAITYNISIFYGGTKSLSQAVTQRSAP